LITKLRAAASLERSVASEQEWDEKFAIHIRLPLYSVCWRRFGQLLRFMPRTRARQTTVIQTSRQSKLIYIASSAARTGQSEAHIHRPHNLSKPKWITRL